MASDLTYPLRNARIGRLQFRAPRVSHKSERQLLAGWIYGNFQRCFVADEKI